MRDLIDKKFGRLIVIKPVGKDKSRNYLWLCLCDCGQTKIISASNLTSGRVRSCGCLNMERLIKHGHSTRNTRTETYETWRGMISRCTNLNDKRYRDYGGRGIIVCKRWMNFANFLEDMGKRPNGKSIDRINNDEEYCKSNCLWTTRKQQNRNTRRNHLETHNRKTQCLSAWAEETGIPKNVILWRLNHGWSIEKALIIPVRKKRKK